MDIQNHTINNANQNKLTTILFRFSSTQLGQTYSNKQTLSNEDFKMIENSARTVPKPQVANPPQQSQQEHEYPYTHKHKAHRTQRTSQSTSPHQYS